jgi:hypothetical protein
MTRVRLVAVVLSLISIVFLTSNAHAADCCDQHLQCEAFSQSLTRIFASTGTAAS